MDELSFQMFERFSAERIATALTDTPVDALYELLEVHDQAYLGRRFLELAGDCAQVMFRRQGRGNHS